MKSTIEINVSEMIIRPSSLNTYLGCSYQWARVFLGGQSTIPNARAAIGTGIHKGVEALWTEAMIRKDKEDLNVSAAIDAAVECFGEEEEKFGIAYGDDEDHDTALREISAGTKAFVEDIIPFAEIPDKVEQRLTIEIPDHPLVKAVSGTLDYLKSDTIADVKTSKRATSAGGHVLQQSTYKLLAEHNGYSIDQNFIHSIIMTKNPSGSIVALDPNMDQAKYVLNNLLDIIELVVEDQIAPEVLFRGNPSYMFCSKKYCVLYDTCPFTNGTPAQATKKDIKNTKAKLQERKGAVKL